MVDSSQYQQALNRAGGRYKFFLDFMKNECFHFRIFYPENKKTVEKGVFHEKLFSSKTVFHAFPRNQTPPKGLILVCTSVNLVLAVYI